MRIRGAQAAIALVLVLTLTGCARRYVLPTGEIDERHSPPSLQGRIAAVAADQMTVAVEDGTSTVVQITPETKFLKVNNGIVLSQELRPDLRIRVWFDSPKNPSGAAMRRAAVVMLASLDPKDDWPKGASAPN